MDTQNISNMLVARNILHQNIQSIHSLEAGFEWESSNQKGIEQPINTTT